MSRAEAKKKKLDILPTFEENIILGRGDKEYYVLQALMTGEYTAVNAKGKLVTLSAKDCFRLAEKDNISNMTIRDEQLVFLDKSRESENRMDIDGDTVRMCYMDIDRSMTVPAASDEQSDETVLIPSYIRRIGQGAFKGTPVRYFRLNNTEVIEDSAFSYSSVSIVDCRGVLKKIGAEAFHGCEDLSFMRGLQSLQEIGDRAFAGCRKLQYFPFNQIQSSNIVFGEQCFRNTVLLSLVLDPCVRNVEIGKRAFKDCAFLTDISIQGSTTIDDYAFYRCKALKKADISKVSFIGVYAFGGTKRLKKITIPENTEIKSTAFDGSYASVKGVAV